MLVVTLSVGWVTNRMNINHAKDVFATRNRELIVELQKEQLKSCERSNKTNDGIHHILEYLDLRRAQAAAMPLTPEQSEVEQHIRNLVPAHQSC